MDLCVKSRIMCKVWPFRRIIGMRLTLLMLLWSSARMLINAVRTCNLSLRQYNKATQAVSLTLTVNWNVHQNQPRFTYSMHKLFDHSIESNWKMSQTQPDPIVQRLNSFNLLNRFVCDRMTSSVIALLLFNVMHFIPAKYLAIQCVFRENNIFIMLNSLTEKKKNE